MGNLNEPYFAEDSKEKIDYFVSLTLKQLQMYNTCESKVNILATISAIFIGATIIFIDKGKTLNQASTIYSTIFNIGIIIMLFLFIISLSIMIWFVGPDKFINPEWVKMKNNEFLPNHRAIYGINQFNNEIEYRNYISTLTLKQISDQIITQIYVLNKMIWKIQGLIKKAEILNITGLIIFILIISIYLF